MAKAVNIARSHRLDGIGEYYFSRRLREIAEIEAATGRQIVKLAMNISSHDSKYCRYFSSQYPCVSDSKPTFVIFPLFICAKVAIFGK